MTITMEKQRAEASSELPPAADSAESRRSVPTRRRARFWPQAGRRAVAGWLRVVLVAVVITAAVTLAYLRLTTPDLDKIRQAVAPYSTGSVGCSGKGGTVEVLGGEGFPPRWIESARDSAAGAVTRWSPQPVRIEVRQDPEGGRRGDLTLIATVCDR
jgi:hypothetical protein